MAGNLEGWGIPAKRGGPSGLTEQEETAVEYEAVPGEHINTTAQRLALIASTQGRRVDSEFNGIKIHAIPGESAEAVSGRFSDECKRRSEAYAASPEGIASAKRAEEYRIKAAAAASEGVLPFNCTDKEIWQSWIDANQDGYGAAVMRYAARWAHIMDAKIANGAKVEDIADKSSHEADLEGISGAQHGFALGMLSKCWAHGTKLKTGN
jgi:hypothetical protein